MEDGDDVEGLVLCGCQCWLRAGLAWESLTKRNMMAAVCIAGRVRPSVVRIGSVGECRRRVKSNGVSKSG